mmetsp:Transcript_23380/g.20779  ORF Transcript_23380/g.20779 Transcript_23380/m.20779 type:complete len:88 (+) Transcript_23380:499-762(+)
MARVVLVNSEYTRDVYHSAFPTLTNEPDILYPCIIEKAFDLPDDFDGKSVINDLLKMDTSKSLPKIIMSLNRYERKKNIGLAIRSFR